ncbi:MAG: LamG-like jellyroll fold domain-containing protein, partial [Bacteroidaceae bacterium]
EVNNESETITVKKDMARPQVLGTPNPSTGILLAGDDISVMFNETVRDGALTQADNFIVTGALNGATVGHSTALQLSGSKQVAATEADILLAKQNFAGDMWINLTSAGTILEHGSAQNKFVVTIDGSGHLILIVNGNTYTSTKTIPLNKWSFLSYNYVYADNASTFSAQVSYDASTDVLFNTISVADYTGIGRLIIGKNLNGAIHEVTLWNRARSLSESQSEMYITKTPSTPNLIGYWKMDEGMGTKVTDCARNRHMIASAANWYLNNVNKAAALDGAGHLALNISACSARSTDDYAVELWFRAESQANASLFAVGDEKLALRTNTSGKLTLVTDGLETVLSSTDYLDNAWHHFALNVLRNGTAIAYVDGTNVKQLAATQVPALAGAAIYVGANRYLNDKGEYAFRNYFKGEVDEFRYWNAKLTGKMLAANRNSRIDTATVSGLVAYYPFETTRLDANNQLVTDFSLMDFSSNAAGDAKVTGVSEAKSAPALKEAPTVTNLQYTFTASEKEVYLTLTDEPSRLEGVTVNFTVRNIRDLNNNLS